MAKQVDLSRISFAHAERRHLSKDEFFKRKINTLVHGSHGTFPKGMNSCAIRLSYALVWAGSPVPVTRRSWRYRGKKSGWLLGSAADFASVFLGERRLRYDWKKKAWDYNIAGKKGAVYFGGAFGGGVSGHVTLWDGVRCHFGSGDGYWDQPVIYFWEMAR